MPFQLTPEQRSAYDLDGYVVVPGFCTSEETTRLYSTALEDSAMKKKRTGSQ
jgi:hypothetical protein